MSLQFGYCVLGCWQGKLTFPEQGVGTFAYIKYILTFTRTVPCKCALCVSQLSLEVWNKIIIFVCCL
jgi:hypothetical protein